jgi:Mono-functional DNA-alkylating methyl methanesulfonate N-term
MDFLYTTEKNENSIFLLLIVAQGSVTSAVLYEWEFTEGIRQTRPKIVTKRVPNSCRLPNLLIPLAKSTSYLLVSPSSIVADSDCSRADAKFKPFINFGSNPPFIWAKWARPYRHAAYDKLHDDIYLCREDGDLQYVQVSSQCTNEASVSVGQLDCDVDCAFDTIDFSHPGHGGDLLIAAGNTGHGGLFIQIARQSPVCVQKFVNWAPVFDAIIIPQLHQKANHSQDLIKDMSDDLHLYVSSASSNNTGAVYEFRHGYEAQIGMIIPLDDFSTARSVWTIPDFAEEGTYFFISDPVSSALLHLSQNEGEEIYAVDDSDSALDLSAQTLAAGYTSTATLVQITPNSVRLTVLGKPRLDFVSDFQIDQTALVATVNDELELVAIVMKSNEKIGLQVGRIFSNDDSRRIDYIGEIVSIEHEPISILIERVKNILYVIVGSSDGHFAYYCVEQDDVVLLGGYTLELNQDYVSKAIESIAVVDWVGTNKAAMYCGLRSGLLVSMDIILDPRNPKDPFSKETTLKLLQMIYLT